MSSLSEQLDSRKLAYLMIERYKAKGPLTPYALEIQPTYRCNYTCGHCAYWQRNHEWHSELSEKDMESLCLSVKELGIKIVYVSGAGEPLMKDYVRRGLIHLRKAGAQVILITNGSLLHVVSPECLKCLKYVQVSIPAASRDLYREITGSDSLAKILKIPRVLSDLCQGQHPQLTAMYVVTSKNLHEVKQAVDTIRDAGYDFLRFRPMVDYEGNNNGLTKKDLRSLARLNVEPSDFTNLHDLHDSPQANLFTQCAALELNLILNVDPSGEVYRCTPDIGHTEHSIGNIHEQSLTDLWYGLKHQDRVQSLKARYLCGGCLQSCRGHRYNELFEHLRPYLPDWQVDPVPAV